MNKLHVTILAGGIGKRMKTNLPKVINLVNGKPMIVRILEQVLILDPYKIIIVVGQNKEIIIQTIKFFIGEKFNDKIQFVEQILALGTGNAVLHTLPFLENIGMNLILNGDTPLLKYETLFKIINFYLQNKSEMLITCINKENPHGNGRIIEENGDFLRIKEEKDCNEEERKIIKINTGIYISENNILKQIIPMIKNNNIQNEYYLTDMVEIYRKNFSKKISLYELNKENEKEIMNVNTKEELDMIQNL